MGHFQHLDVYNATVFLLKKSNCTLYMIYSVTYYLEIRNFTIVYCASHFLLNYGQSGCLDNIEH